MRLLRTHKVLVETYLGATPRGDSYAAPVEVRCFLDHGSVYTSTANAEAVQENSRIYAALKDATRFLPQSRVTLPDGAKARVSKVVLRDGGGLLRAARHTEVHIS